MNEIVTIAIANAEVVGKCSNTHSIDILVNADMLLAHKTESKLSSTRVHQAKHRCSVQQLGPNHLRHEYYKQSLVHQGFTLLNESGTVLVDVWRVS